MCYLMIGRNEAESFCDLPRGGATTDVEEVGWFSAVQFNDVHCCHCKTRSIHWHRSHIPTSCVITDTHSQSLSDKTQVK